MSIIINNWVNNSGSILYTRVPCQREHFIIMIILQYLIFLIQFMTMYPLKHPSDPTPTRIKHCDMNGQHCKHFVLTITTNHLIWYWTLVFKNHNRQSPKWLFLANSHFKTANWRGLLESQKCWVSIAGIIVLAPIVRLTLVLM